MNSSKGESESKSESTPSVPTGVVPPDAPPRETSEEDYQELTGKAAKNKEEKPAEKKPTKRRGRPKGSTTKRKTPGTVVYIGCAPQRSDVEPTLFEDWFAPIEQWMNDYVQNSEAQPHWMLLPYGPQKALLSTTVKEWVEKGLPPALLVQAPTHLWNEVSPFVLPSVAQVVRAYK